MRASGCWRPAFPVRRNGQPVRRRLPKEPVPRRPPVASRPCHRPDGVEEQAVRAERPARVRPEKARHKEKAGADEVVPPRQRRCPRALSP